MNSAQFIKDPDRNLALVGPHEVGCQPKRHWKHAARADAGEQVAVPVRAEPDLPGHHEQQHGLESVYQAASDVGADQP